jgi:hypothetical protein
VVLTCSGDEGRRQEFKVDGAGGRAWRRPDFVTAPMLRWLARDGKRRYGFSSSSRSSWRRRLAPGWPCRGARWRLGSAARAVARTVSGGQSRVSGTGSGALNGAEALPWCGVHE